MGSTLLGVSLYEESLENFVYGPLWDRLLVVGTKGVELRPLKKECTIKDNHNY